MINLKKWLGLEMYVSELDQFLTQYDKDHTLLSISQKREIDKSTIVSAKRDHEQKVSTRASSIINKLLG